MIILKNVRLIDGSVETVELESEETIEMDASHLTLMQALIDPHVHFRVPGQDYKEDWFHAAKAAIKGGYTMVLDMPNNIPACVNQKRLIAKKELINSQLDDCGIPLKYDLYIGADKNHFDEIVKVADDVVGIKVFMGSSTGELLMDDDSSLHAIFALAKAHGLTIALHAEDEELIQKRSKAYKDHTDHQVHSKIRTPQVAVKAVEKALELSCMYEVPIYLLHISTVEELALIEQAKEQGVEVYAETTPHHLFLNTDDYRTLHGRVQMNPPIRERVHQEALFEAIRSGVIDTIGSDHAPHTEEEKDQAYGKTPSGVPGIETTLPLLLNAVNEGQLELSHVASLTRWRPIEILNLEDNMDYVLVDMNHQAKVNEETLKTKCGWSPFVGRELQGWPKYTIMDGVLYDLEKL
jgi:dihydroorotase